MSAVEAPKAARAAGIPLFKRATAAAFYRLIHWLSDPEIPWDTGADRQRRPQQPRAATSPP